MFASPIAYGEILFFGGETIGTSGYAIGNPIGQFDEVYDDFDLAATTRVTSIYADVYDTIAGAVPARRFEIRTGLSAGNPGTLVASGESLPTSVEALTGVPPSAPFHQIRVSGLDIELEPGRYWLMIYLSRVLSISETRGVNGVGSPIGNGNAFVTSPFRSAYFTPIHTGNFGHPNPDFGYGVEGTVVPEPASVFALGVGVLTCLRRRSVRFGPSSTPSA